MMERHTDPTGYQGMGHFLFTIAAALMIYLSAIEPAIAKPVGSDVACRVTRGWLKGGTNRFGMAAVTSVMRTETRKDDKGHALYHVVYLEGGGFVVVAGDDLVESIVAFSSGNSSHGPGETLTSLLALDLGGRMESVRAMGSVKNQSRLQRIEKWSIFEAQADQSDDRVAVLGFSGISDIRVGPLTQSEWGQGEEYGGYCYDYYTPNHWPAGCVATAMSQLMRYHSYPTSGIGSHNFTITVSGVPQSAWTMGGGGAGGAYEWDQMPLDPVSAITVAQRQAIGALCYDAGVTVEMQYDSNGSSASSYDAGIALASIFQYGNAVYGYNSGGEIGSGLNNMLNPNLDAGLPVMLSIERTGGGHAVLCDGYGYDYGTLYHHLNMGWYGSDNVWYDLPDIDTSSYDYTVVDGCVYNIFVSGSGEIVSGRVTDMGGNPLEDATVVARIGSTVVKESTTNSNGIYALVNLSSGQSYTIHAEKSPHAFIDQQVTTGTSSDWNSTAGNRWQIDFASQNASPPLAYDQNTEALAGTTKLITLTAGDEGYPDPPGELVYYVSGLPRYGTLSESGVGAITAVPYQLSANMVEYLPCAYFAGQDTVEFYADDDGDPPTGGISNIGTVSIEVDNHLYMTFDPTTNWVANDPIDTYYVDARMQAVYWASELNGPQTIIGLALEITDAPGLDLTNWTIRMQHTSMSSFTTGNPVPFWLTSGWTTVYQNNESATPTGWREFVFDQQFEYNGTSNLMIDYLSLILI